MGISFILPLPQLPLSADPGGSTGVQIGRREGVKRGNLLSHKLTAHAQALSVAFSESLFQSMHCMCPCQSPLYTLSLNFSLSVYLSALDSRPPSTFISSSSHPSEVSASKPAVCCLHFYLTQRLIKLLTVG